MTETEKKQTKDNDIISVILEDHRPLKELIRVMKDLERPFEERAGAFKEFAPTLTAHAKPEEAILYKFMKNKKELREDGFEGDVEHAIADQLVEEIKRTNDRDLRSARIKVLAELVEHHIEEEESQLLPDVRKHSESQERMMLGDRFLKEKIKYLAAGDDNVIDDPKLRNEPQKH